MDRRIGFVLLILILSLALDARPSRAVHWLYRENDLDRASGIAKVSQALSQAPYSYPEDLPLEAKMARYVAEHPSEQSAALTSLIEWMKAGTEVDRKYLACRLFWASCMVGTSMEEAVILAHLCTGRGGTAPEELILNSLSFSNRFYLKSKGLKDQKNGDYRGVRTVARKDVAAALDRIKALDPAQCVLMPAQDWRDVRRMLQAAYWTDQMAFFDPVPAQEKLEEILGQVHQRISAHTIQALLQREARAFDFRTREIDRAYELNGE